MCCENSTSMEHSTNSMMFRAAGIKFPWFIEITPRFARLDSDKSWPGFTRTHTEAENY